MVSSAHESLVDLILEWIEEEYLGMDFQLFHDSVGLLGANRPRSIFGYVPDVFFYVPAIDHTIIGDAKTPNDIETKHSKAQLEAYARYLTGLKGSGELVVSTRHQWAACARSVLRNLKTVKEDNLKTTVLCELGKWG